MRKPHLYPPNMPVTKLAHFANAADVDTVIDCELQELKQYNPGPAKTVYIGGGSPSYLAQAQLRLLEEAADVGGRPLRFLVQPVNRPLLPLVL